MVASPSASDTSQPSRRSTSAMIATSVMRGTLETTLRPSASRATAISLSAEFLAPPTVTSPDRRAPPLTLITSTRAIVWVAPTGLRRVGGMAVHLTRIYTRAGDAASPRLGNNEVAAKTDPRVVAYADADECNAAIGVALALGALAPDVKSVLTAVQNDLFDVGADLCNPLTEDPPYPPLRIQESYVTRLEAWCDEYNEQLPKPDSLSCPAARPEPRCCTWPARWP